MPLSKAPRRPSTVGMCRACRQSSQQERWAEALGPYMEPLPPRRAATATAERARAVKASRRQVPPSTTKGAEIPAANGEGAISQLTDDERSICNLMVGVLQHKSSLEARRIVAEVSEAAQSRRLLASYSGVYANACSDDDNEAARNGESGSGRTQLIRHLQKRREEEERASEEERKQQKHINDAEEREQRARWRNMFGGGGGRANGSGTPASRRKKGRSNGARKLVSDTDEEHAHPQQQQEQQQQQQQEQQQQQQQEQQQQQQQEQQQQQQQDSRKCGEDNAALRSSAGTGIPPNVPRRMKAVRHVASFDEQCADRYGGAAASKESLSSASLVRLTQTSVGDDSVRQSPSVRSPGAGDEEGSRSQGLLSDADEAPSALMATRCPTAAGDARETSEAALSGFPPVPRPPRLPDASNHPLPPPVVPIIVEAKPPSPPSPTGSPSLSAVSNSSVSSVEEELNGEGESEKENGKSDTVVDTEGAAAAAPTKFPWELDDEKLPWEL
ncbi:hypothetical protein DQ04_07431040 [Trypanosoma grayi]|uniref:hypothetical protein n=1 Tax=Trypanosoma grayi TaxID=71804 RepID=UPI0004F4312A|nr:hypothetical protein DQ04_07431040 [Trypanosoma grayi]KEG08337.1 hypothetical protein DQ04_07431040 [Trypanosoma grayi]